MTSKSKILYVEDNEDNIYMLTARLKRRGYDVVVATDGRQGVAMAHSELPALILMDLGLPVMNGWDATRELKTSPKTGHIPVIALSAHSLVDDKKNAFAAGCDDFVSKPIDFSELIQKIELFLPTEPAS
jgi:CheY-like chemotaxis protein